MAGLQGFPAMGAVLGLGAGWLPVEGHGHPRHPTFIFQAYIAKIAFITAVITYSFNFKSAVDIHMYMISYSYIHHHKD